MNSIYSVLLSSLVLVSGSVAAPHEASHGSPGHGDHHGGGECGSAAPLTVTTKAGTVTGFINSTAPNVRQWLGIPYAEPPVGRLRFMPPKAKKRFGHLETKA